MKTRCYTLALFALLACPVASTADLHVELKVTNERGQAGQTKKEEGTHHIYIKKDKVAKSDHKGKTEITRFDQEVQYKVYAQRKSFRKRTFAQMAERIKKRTERMAQSPNKVAYTVEVAEGEVEVAGHKTRHYTVKMNGKKLVEIWACESLDKDGLFRKMMMLSPPPGKKSADEIGKIKGVWLKWKMEMNQGGFVMSETAEATKVSTDAVDDKKFEVPEGYKEQ